MDLKITPPATTTDRPLLAVEPVKKQGQTAQTAPEQSRATDSTPATSQVDTSATSNLVELVRHDAQNIHTRMLEQLQTDISSGSYNADLDVVAERVAEVLGAA